MDKKTRIKLFRSLFMDLQLWDVTHVNSLVEEMEYRDFFTAPASTKYHGAYEGGLFDHSYEVTMCLVELTKKLGLKWEYERSPYVIGMFHDLCKTDQYRRKEDGSGWEYVADLPLIGHGEKSVIMTQQFLMLSEEEILCIRWHMGAYDNKENWNSLGKAIEKYPNVLWTHTADMMASRIKGV